MILDRAGQLVWFGSPLGAEWFLLEALMQQFRIPGLGFRLVLRWLARRSRSQWVSPG
jgi:hypothetical protein